MANAEDNASRTRRVANVCAFAAGSSITLTAIAVRLAGATSAPIFAAALLLAIGEFSIVALRCTWRGTRHITWNKVVTHAAAAAVLAGVDQPAHRQAVLAPTSAVAAALLYAFSDESTGTSVGVATTAIAGVTTLAVGIAAPAPLSAAALVLYAVTFTAINLWRAKELGPAPALADEHWFPSRSLVLVTWELRRSAAVLVTANAWLAWAAVGVAIKPVFIVVAIACLVLCALFALSRLLVGSGQVPLDATLLAQSVVGTEVQDNE